MYSKTVNNLPANSGDDLVMPQTRVVLADLLTKIRRGEAGYDLAVKFLEETTGAPPANGV